MVVYLSMSCQVAPAVTMVTHLLLLLMRPWWILFQEWIKRTATERSSVRFIFYWFILSQCKHRGVDLWGTCSAHTWHHRPAYYLWVEQCTCTIEECTDMIDFILRHCCSGISCGWVTLTKRELRKSRDICECYVESLLYTTLNCHNTLANLYAPLQDWWTKMTGPICFLLLVFHSLLRILQLLSNCYKLPKLTVDAPSPPPQHPLCSSEPLAYRRERHSNSIPQYSK